MSIFSKTTRFFQTLILSLVVVVISVFTGFANAANQALTPNIQRMKKIFSAYDTSRLKLLFIQQAKSATLTPDPKKPGCYLLQIKQLQPKVLFFSDEPEKVTGHLSVPSFVYLVKNNQKHYRIQPNVAIEAYKENGSDQEINIVLSLTNPVLTGNADNMALTFTACPLNKDDRIKSIKQLKNINLFFDHMHGWPP